MERVNYTDDRKIEKYLDEILGSDGPASMDVWYEFFNARSVALANIGIVEIGDRESLVDGLYISNEDLFFEWKMAH